MLEFDSSNVEAIACLASNYFYTDQPEMALRFYRRLLQMGLQTAELWSNLGLWCDPICNYGDATVLKCKGKGGRFKVCGRKQ